MYAPKAHSLVVLTIVESPLFQKLWPLYWSAEEPGEFAAYLAIDPTAGVVIRESGGLRKVRWARPGTGGPVASGSFTSRAPKNAK